MMTKHTPGEWKQKGRLIYSENGMVCELSEPRKTEYIRHYRVALDSPDHEEAMANARLIAAAPELLEACEMVVLARSVYETEELTPDHIGLRQLAFAAGVSPAEYVMDMIRAAIAKAGGE